MVVGTLSLVQKGQTSGCSGRTTLWTQYAVDAVDAVDAVHSGIVVYGVGDIVFGAKSSNQWMQWMQSHSRHRSNQLIQYAVDAVE